MFMDDIATLVAIYLGVKEHERGYKTIALTSALIGGTFFVFMLLWGFLFADSTLLLMEILLLGGLSLLLGVFVFLFSYFIKWMEARYSRDSKDTTP